MARLNLEQKRLYVMNAYPGLSWHRKVSMMPSKQICAICEAIKTKWKEQHPRLEPKKEPDNYHQIDIWEYMCIKKGGMKNDN